VYNTEKATTMKNLTVLHLINNFGDSSITRIVRDLARHLGQHDFTWHVGGLSGMGDMQDEFRQMGAKVADFAGTDGSARKTMQRIRDYVAENRIGIVHTHTPRTILMLRLALGRRHQPLHVATKHILNFPGDRRWGLFYSLTDRLLLYSPDHLVAVSGKVYREVMACPGITSARISMIRNAVDSTPFHLPDQRDPCRLEFGLTPEHLLIGTTGRLEKVKRYDLLLQAFSTVHKHFPQSRLMIAGDGTLKHELENFADELKIGDAVIWTGFRKDIPRLLAAMDIYCMPSANEGLSLSILEAMAAGKPVIITDVGGARELVEDGKTGLLISPGSVEPIEESIMDLLRNPEKRAAIAHAGRDYVVQEFGIMRMMESYGNLYKTLSTRLQ
jgi:glycosyltransferase involved in cell wall biosynthesis